jgi:predicted Fe-Mo cluster-binding NifX family protein
LPVSWQDVNDYIEQGDELGFILFGSRVDLFLPANTALKVKTGDKVKANINPIAAIAYNDADKECKWYPVCPMKEFYEQGKLDKKWIELYCKGAWLNCIRYQMEENGESHPDNMMPDGSIDDYLTILRIMSMEKYLVASSGDTLDSKVSGRFGHSGYFMIIDPRTMEYETFTGVSTDEDQNIGKFITPAVKKVIVGNIGPSSYSEILSYGCKVYLCRNMSVNEAVSKVKNDEVPILKEPTLKDSIHSARKAGDGGRGTGRGMGMGQRDGRGMGRGMGRGIGGGKGKVGR